MKLFIIGFLIVMWSLGQIVPLHSQATQNKVEFIRPAWSPKGKFFAYLSNQSGTYQVYKIDHKLQRPVQISNAPEGVSVFKWSPNGKQIAFLSKDQLYTIHSDGTKKQLIIASGASPLFNWTPDGKSICYSKRTEGKKTDIIQVGLTSGKVTPLVTHPATERNFSLAPNSKQMVFGSNRAGSFDIFLLDLISQKVKQLTNFPQNAIDPLFSPNGKSVVFIVDRDEDNKNFDTFLLSLKDQNIQKISSQDGYNLPLWFSNNKKLLMSSNGNGKWEVYQMDIKKMKSKKVTDGLAFSIHPKEKKVLLQSRQSGKNEIYLFHFESGMKTLLSPFLRKN